ncbi:MAG: hypothetical protein ACK2U3_06170 [Anaerolineales bacterium]
MDSAGVSNPELVARWTALISGVVSWGSGVPGDGKRRLQATPTNRAPGTSSQTAQRGFREPSAMPTSSRTDPPRKG